MARKRSPETPRSLHRFPGLRSLPDEVLAGVAQTAQHLRAAKDAAIFSEGDPPEAVYLLDDGLIKTVKYSSRVEGAGLGFVMPGELFGAIALLDRHPYPVTAVAVRDSDVLHIPAATFETLMSDHSVFAKSVFEQVGRHVRSAQALKALMTEPASRRIARILLDLSAAAGGGELRLLREDLASMAGLNFSTTVRELSRLRRAGVIRTGWKRLAVTKPDQLEKQLD